MTPQPSPLMNFLPLIAISLIFYFLILRPQQKQAKEHEAMLGALKKGDRVLTNGGLYGVVVNVRGPEVDVKIADNVKVVLAKNAVTKVMNAANAAPESSSVQS